MVRKENKNIYNDVRYLLFQIFIKIIQIPLKRLFFYKQSNYHIESMCKNSNAFGLISIDKRFDTIQC